MTIAVRNPKTQINQERIDEKKSEFTSQSSTKFAVDLPALIFLQLARKIRNQFTLDWS